MESFNRWNKQKKWFHNYKKRPIPRKREIWWCIIGKNIGTEIYGKGTHFTRPAIILKKISNQGCIIIPITSGHKNSTNHYNFIDENNKRQSACIHQIKYIDTKRLNKKAGKISRQELIEIIDKTKTSLL